MPCGEWLRPPKMSSVLCNVHHHAIPKKIEFSAFVLCHLHCTKHAWKNAQLMAVRMSIGERLIRNSSQIENKSSTAMDGACDTRRL